MTETFTFFPQRTFGIVFHVLLTLLILASCGLMIWQAVLHVGSVLLIVFLLGAVALFLLIPFIAYRGYALLQASYSLKRDGLRIRWGLRAEDVPLSEVIWVRPATDLEIPLKLPPFSLPGALTGIVRHADLGQVEFIASSVRELVIVATLDHYYALSPAQAEEFVQRFQRALEMGTLTPMQPYSAIPTAFMRQIALDRYGRALIPFGLLLTLGLLLLVGFSMPGFATISMGYDPNGNLLPPVPSTRFLLLPVLAVLLYLGGSVAGVYFYRNAETRPVAWLAWSGSVLSPALLFIAALLFLLAN